MRMLKIIVLGCVLAAVAITLKKILLPEGIRPEQARPIRSETRTRLVAAIARGRRWLDELVADH